MVHYCSEPTDPEGFSQACAVACLITVGERSFMFENHSLEQIVRKQKEREKEEGKAKVRAGGEGMAGARAGAGRKGGQERGLEEQE